MYRSSIFRSLMFGAVLGAAPLPLPAVVGQHHADKRLEQREIRVLEEKWRQAQLADDIPATDKLLSDEFLGVTASGQVVTKLQQLDRMRTRRIDLKTINVSDTKVKISGNLAVVTSQAVLDGTADGAPLRGCFRYTRVYQRTLGGWHITNFEATRVGRPQLPSQREAQPTPAAAGASSRPASPAKYVSLQPPS